MAGCKCLGRDMTLRQLHFTLNGKYSSAAEKQYKNVAPILEQ
jgi:hypothetical protein